MCVFIPLYIHVCTILTSYLNIFEEKDLEIERKFFESHPELGKFENRVIVGALLPPPQEDPDFIKVYTRTYILYMCIYMTCVHVHIICTDIYGRRKVAVKVKISIPP